MTATTTSVLGKPLLIIAILATSVWLAAQKGCMPMPDVAPKPVAFTIQEEGPALIQAHQSFTQSSEPKSRSLKQAIAILKHEAIPGIDLPDHERVSMQTVPVLNEAFERKTSIVNN